MGSKSNLFNEGSINEFSQLLAGLYPSLYSSTVIPTSRKARIDFSYTQDQINYESPKYNTFTVNPTTGSSYS